MPEVTIHGGGTALKTAWKNGTISTSGCKVYVEPGIYDGGIFRNVGFNNIDVYAVGGKDSTFIDGYGVMQVTDGYKCGLIRGTASYNNTIRFHNFTFRNGYLSGIAGVNGGDFGAATRGVTLYDCGIYDCSSWISGEVASTTQRNPASLYGTTAYNCEISGCWSNSLIANNCNLYNCNIHDNECVKPYNADKANILAGVRILNSKIHHNRSVGVLVYTTILKGCELYSNECIDSSRVMLQRGCAINCTFCKNRGWLRMNDVNGGKCCIKNCVFFDNKELGATNYKIHTGHYTGNSFFVNNALDFLSSQVYLISRATVSSSVMSGNLFGISDPGFKDYESDDYRLISSSILIHTGTDLYIGNYKDYSGIAISSLPSKWTEIDIDGKKLNVEHPSIGAHEFYPRFPDLPTPMNPFGLQC